MPPPESDSLDKLLADFEEFFDPDVDLLWQYEEKIHDHKQSLSYATALLERGRPEDVERAGRIIERALSTQNTVEGSHRYGNFKWTYEDKTITDINAVQFCVSSLLGIIQQFGDRLRAELKEQITRSIAIGLVEEAALDVPWHYTNITLIQMGNLILGGELLGSGYRTYSNLGYRRLHEWIEMANRNGAVFEYNSPGYCSVDIIALGRIAGSCGDREAALAARIMEERLWIHVAARFHPGSAKLAGPYARAYQPSICGTPLGIYDLFYGATGNEEILRSTPYYDPDSYHARAYRGFRPFRRNLNPPPGKNPLGCPEYVRRLIADKPMPYYVQETSDKPGGNDITTYLTEEYALGTNAKTYQETDRGQPGLWTPLCKSLVLHYRRPEPYRFGVLYSLYVVNDLRISEYYHEIHGGVDGITTADRYQDERGLVRSVQHHNKAIVLYHPPQLQEDISSLRTEVIVLGRAAIKRIFVGETEVASLPVSLSPADTLFLEDGNTFIAILPLEPSNLGEPAAAPVELIEDSSGNLVLAIYNYRGPKKPFWEYKTRMPYFRANAKAGFVIEVGSTGEYPSFEAFRAHIESSRITDTTDEAFIRQVEYQSDGDAISITVDLKTDALLERCIDGKVYEAPFLSANTVKEDNSGHIEVGNSTLITDPRPAWLLADEGLPCYVAATPSDQGGPLVLRTPEGTLECDDFGFGRIAYMPGGSPGIDILAKNFQSPVYFPCRDGSAPVVYLNREDVSSHVGVNLRNGKERYCLTV